MYIQASWPPVSITAPSRLRLHSSDVAATVSFTRSLCATFSSSSSGGGNRIPSKSSSSSWSDVESRLDLVECSKSVLDPDGQDCQV